MNKKKKMKQYCSWIHRVHRPATESDYHVSLWMLFFSLTENKCNIYIYMSWLDIRRIQCVCVCVTIFVTRLSLIVSKVSIKAYIVEW